MSAKKCQVLQKIWFFMDCVSNEFRKQEKNGKGTHS